ncbi:PaaI family thioesterase [Agromyces bauzanensis]
MTPAAAGELIASDPVCRSAGIVVIDVGEHVATLRMPVTADMATSLGIAHAGFVMMLADTASGAVAIAVDDTAITTGADVSFLSPARVGDVLVATARLRARSGRSLLIDVAVGTAGDGDRVGSDGVDSPDARLVAEFRARARTRTAGPRAGSVRD